MTKVQKSSEETSKLVAAALALALTWLVVSTSCADYLARSSPALASWFHWQAAGARLALAERSLETYQRVAAAKPQDPTDNQAPPAAEAAADPAKASADAIAPAKSGVQRAPSALEGVPAGVRGEIVDEILRVVRYDPLNSRALRLLGQIRDAEGDDAAAQVLMQAAAHLSLRETPAVIWLFQNAQSRKDHAAMVRYLDVLFRTRLEALPFAEWQLTQMAESPDANAVVKDVLAQNPSWRRRYFADIGSFVSDARTPLDLMLSLRETPAPATADERRFYLDFLVGKGFYELAYYSWLQFLDPSELSSVGFLSNGSFERPLTRTPFDWTVESGSGATVDVVPRLDAPGQHALSVEFTHGRVDFRGVRQYAMLAPGSYTFAGVHSGRLRGRRGLVWRVSCAKSGTHIAESAALMDGGRSWKPFSFEFTVPESECKVQRVELGLAARSASETMVTGEMQFDDIVMARRSP